MSTLSDPMERRIREALTRAKLAFVDENDPKAVKLDFYVVPRRVHIEVKQFPAHNDRIARQMARVPYCIAAQGKFAVEWLAELIEKAALYDAQVRP